MEQYQTSPPVLARDKYWREKTAEQKCEVLADLLLQAIRDIRTLTERADEIVSHNHHPTTGQLLVVPREPYPMGRYAVPPGYNHEEFALGRAPGDSYPRAPLSWAEEAQAEGALPKDPRQPEPATGAQDGSGGTPLEDPDWPKPAPNPQFHPVER